MTLDLATCIRLLLFFSLVVVDQISSRCSAEPLDVHTFITTHTH